MNLNHFCIFDDHYCIICSVEKSISGATISRGGNWLAELSVDVHNRGAQIPKYCIRISPRILTTDPRPRTRPQADAVSDPLSVRESATHFLTTSPQAPAAAVCPVTAFAVVQSMWAWLGHWITIDVCSWGAWSVTREEGLTETKRVHQHYRLASAHCARRVSLPNAELE